MCGNFSSTALDCHALTGIENGAQELSCAVILRILEQLVRMSLLGDIACIKKTHPIRDLSGKSHLMRDHEHGQAMLGGKFSDDVQNFSDHFGIER